MNITLEADYAIRIVHCLSMHGKRMDAKHISELTGVTLRFSLKILRKLVGAGIVKSFKGTQGGYELAKSPAEISLAEVLEVIEGPYNLNRCGTGEFVCTRIKDKPCAMQKIFCEISRDVRERLDKAKFADFI
ncbi:MAG: Rrf2 family transcriptional regulator [Oscillospiraceae bacterium]|nr:Rrf2 family transcriptional regulator [Oscillospiraceae bacterium]